MPIEIFRYIFGQNIVSGKKNFSRNYVEIMEFFWEETEN